MGLNLFKQPFFLTSALEENVSNQNKKQRYLKRLLIRPGPATKLLGHWTGLIFFNKG